MLRIGTRLSVKHLSDLTHFVSDPLEVDTLMNLAPSCYRGLAHASLMTVASSSPVSATKFDLFFAQPDLPAALGREYNFNQKIGVTD